MRRIYKYALGQSLDRQTISMYEGAKILSFNMQDDHFYIWAHVDTDRPIEERFFKIVLTGEGIMDEENLIFIGSHQKFNDEQFFVTHLFEIVKKRSCDG